MITSLLPPIREAFCQQTVGGTAGGCHWGITSAHRLSTSGCSAGHLIFSCLATLLPMCHHPHLHPLPVCTWHQQSTVRGLNASGIHTSGGKWHQHRHNGIPVPIFPCATHLPQLAATHQTVADNCPQGHITLPGSSPQRLRVSTVLPLHLSPTIPLP